MRLFQPAGKEPVSSPGQLILHQQLQEIGEGQLMVDGFLVAGVQRGCHAGQSQ